MEANVIVTGLDLSKETILKLVTEGGEVCGFGSDSNDPQGSCFAVRVVCIGSNANKIGVVVSKQDDCDDVILEDDIKFGLNVKGITIDNEKSPRANMLDDGVFIPNLLDMVGAAIADYLGEAVFRSYTAVPYNDEYMIVSVLTPNTSTLAPFDVKNTGAYYDVDTENRNKGVKVCECGCNRPINYTMPVSVSLSLPYDVHKRYDLKFEDGGITVKQTGNDHTDAILNYIGNSTFDAVEFRNKHIDFFQKKSLPDLSEMFGGGLKSLKDLGIDLDGIAKDAAREVFGKPKKPKSTVH